MMKSIEQYVPEARQEDLVIEGLGDETLVYDLRTHRAHCLNRTVAVIWNHCDGKSTAAEIGVILERVFHARVSTRLIWLAFDQLYKARLLLNGPPRSIHGPAISRRAAVKKIGLGAAVALPLVTSIIAPTTAEAVTCRAIGQPCVSFNQCCSLKCAGTCIN
jgi:hypothetical protein